MGSETPIDEAGKFINAYLHERDLMGDLSSTSLTSVLDRADEARERFKNSRPKDDAVIDHSSLTQSQKYRRRLENNKKSAAATRVYNEVLKKESARVIRDLELSEHRARDEMAHLQARLQLVEDMLARTGNLSSIQSNENKLLALQTQTSQQLGPQSTPTSVPSLFSYPPLLLPPMPTIRKVTSRSNPTSPISMTYKTVSPNRGGCIKIAPAPHPIFDSHQHTTQSQQGETARNNLQSWSDMERRIRR